MVVFWVATAALSLLAIGFVVGGARRAARTPSEADPTLGLYRRQMDELDDLIERGLLAPAEQRIARAETGRRLLAAAEDEAVAGAGGKINQAAAIAGLIGVPIIAVAVYLLVGAPGRPDQPYAGRIAEWRTADPQELGPERTAAVLQEAVRSRPNDVQGRRLLAEMPRMSGQTPQALSNLRAAIALEPQHADLWMMLGAALMASNQGTFVPEAENAFRKALEVDPKSFDARYALGRARVEAGAPAEGLALWRSLLVDLPADSDSRPELERQIAGVAATGRVPPRVDPQAQAQADASAPEMQAAIRGMVEGLAGRLAENPDNPEGWVRLVRAYAVLGETDKLNSALTTARARYRNDPQLMAALAQAAEAPR
jgi:cytochrome c-type biogenesis protein CcmH